MRAPVPPIRTPDQRLRVFVSSTLGELAEERRAVRAAIERLRLTPVMFELGARPHPPRELYRAYLEQSHVFVGIYWQRYGWVAPGEEVSGLEDEYRLAGSRPRLLYLKRPAPAREERLGRLVADFVADDQASYHYFRDAEELAELVADDLAVLLTERFHDESGPGEGREPVPLPPAPVPTTPTVGRRAAVAEAVDLLGGERRLVTLTGPGGIGKTRLALETAARIAASGTAVGYVALADADDVGTALHALAPALGASRPEGGDLRERLVERLRGRDVVLVLDNLEQVLEIGPVLADLLERLPGLRVLATSRRALRVRAEAELPVRPLTLPSVDAGPEEVAASAAVRLFLDRASATAPDVAEVDLPVVAEICRRLDGLPLAIELAAARVRVLPPAVLLDQLGASLDVLGPGARDLPARQRTLRATLEWSVGLLSPPERRFLEDLSVFAGGWTLAAAQEVADPGLDVLEGTAALLDHGLVVGRYAAGGEPRFTMLRTVRTFAAGELSARADAEAARRRHLAWVRRLGEQAQPYLCGPGQREWLARIDPETANIAEAVRNALALGDDEAVVELTWDVVVHYFVRDAVGEPHAWLGAVAAAGRPLPHVVRAKLDCLHTLTRIHHGDLADAAVRLTGALDVFRDEGMDFESAVALHQLGFVAFLVDHDVDRAVALLQESSATFDRVGHDWGVSLAEAMAGSVLTEVGEHAAAERHLLTALDRGRAIDCEPQVVQAQVHLAQLRLRQERPDEAVALVREVEPLLHTGRYLTDASFALEIVGAVAGRSGRPDLARHSVAAARAVRGRLGVHPWPGMQELVDRNRVLAGPDGAAARDDDLFAVLAQGLAGLDGTPPSSAPESAPTG